MKLKPADFKNNCSRIQVRIF